MPAPGILVSRLSQRPGTPVGSTMADSRRRQAAVTSATISWTTSEGCERLQKVSTSRITSASFPANLKRVRSSPAPKS
ncbi:MAG: hypothetical protein E6J02_07320 [Chloroflexi bacterium]|nr:MAG: hypothetical protein E6J02_07320 [Chloroflexota bacterium]